MLHLPTTFIGLLSLILVFAFYLASTDISKTLSPQGCRMSWMSPSYILQSGFNSSWSPLAERYSLWLYREVGWEGTPVNGVPVMFIPGNAGSSHQVRSIASSAARQFYQSPYVVSEEFAGREVKPLDFYAVEFNEDLSAFHGPTLDSQISYSSRAVSYILSHYPPNTPIIVMGHSMGGVVATSLLPSPDISAIITMSTPHTLPPARFDSRIDKIYAHNQQILQMDSAPILSLCGGATDIMIPSESCVLPAIPNNTTKEVFRQTVFTSALEGSWTGVGHREMVWCHQVRWRVARAALELGGSSSKQAIASTLDRWLRDGSHLPSATHVSQKDLSLVDSASYETLPTDTNLVLQKPRGSRTYLFPIPSSISPSKFILYVSQGSIPPVSPQTPNSLRASVYFCNRRTASESSAQAHLAPPLCTTLSPSVLKLIPSPIPGKPFPIPDEGSDESEGVVLFEVDVHTSNTENKWVAVNIQDASGAGWIIGGFAAFRDSDGAVVSDVGPLAPFLGKVSIKFPPSVRKMALRTEVQIPNILSNALVIYRLTPMAGFPSPTQSGGACAESLLPPLLMHTSYPSETHYFPLMHAPPQAILLHTHSRAPYIPYIHSIPSRGLNLTLYSSTPSNCITGVNIQVDWWATFGRWGSRYSMTILSWAICVVALVIFGAWQANDKGSPTPSVQQSLAMFVSSRFTNLLIGSFAVACLPLPTNYYLGTKGEPLLAPIAPVILFIVTGLVLVSSWMLSISTLLIGSIGRMVSRRQGASLGATSALVSVCLILMLIFVFVPWQVAFLGCWAIHLHTSATLRSRPTRVERGAAIQLIDRSLKESDILTRPETTARSTNQTRSLTDALPINLNDHHRNMHILLLMTWLLPLVAPVLAVWVRTLMTAGYTVPFDGDHNFMNVTPFLLLVDSRFSGRGPEVEDSLLGRQIVQWSFLVLAMVAMFPGPRTVYRVFDMANIVVALIVIVPRVQMFRISLPKLMPTRSR